MLQKINWPIIVIIIIALGFWGIYTFGNYKGTMADKNPINETKQASESLDKNDNSNTRNDNLTYTGWIPDWASEAGFSTVSKQKNLFNDISPVWYEVSKNGDLVDIKPPNTEGIIKLSKENQIKLIPSIAMFDHEIFTEVLQNSSNLTRHIDAIHQTVMQNEYDGIDLDYESTKLSDKDKYFEFLERLSKKFRESNKTLVVTVLAKWGENIEYPYLPQTREVQNWKRIAEFADEIRIMTYDYTSASALNPGPIAPLDWMQQVIDYALTQADASKFVLGVHLYSYERWVEIPDQTKDLGFSDPQLQFKNNYSQNNAVRTAPARSYDYSVVENILSKNQGKTEEYQGEQIYRYSKTNETTGIYENRVLVYIDPQGVEARTELAKASGLRGIAFWQLGSGDELLQGLK